MSFGIARLLVDIGKHRDETSVTNVIDRDRMQVRTPAVSITCETVVKDTDKKSIAYKTRSDETERRTDVSDIPGRIDIQMTDISIHRDEASVTNTLERDKMQVSTPVVSVSHKKVDNDRDRGKYRLPYMPEIYEGHIAQKDHKATTKKAPSLDKSLTHNMSGSDDDIHVKSLTQSKSMQRSYDMTFDRSIERLKRSVTDSQGIIDRKKESKIDEIEETDRDQETSTDKQYDMTNA